MEKKKKKGRTGLSSTYRNDTGANAELTMGVSSKTNNTQVG